MSKATELARAEADRVEAAEKDAPPDDTSPNGAADGADAPTEPDEGVAKPTRAQRRAERREQEQAAADEGASFERALRQLEREQERHEQELRAIMGDDFDAFEGCPTCDGMGFRPLASPVLDPAVETCTACAGHGFLITGSLRPERAVRDCMSCQGNGYRNRAPATPAPAADPTPARPRFDPYTGLPLEGGDGGDGGDGSGWAPGYVPGGRPADTG